MRWHLLAGKSSWDIIKAKNLHGQLCSLLKLCQMTFKYENQSKTLKMDRQTVYITSFTHFPGFQNARLSPVPTSHNSAIMLVVFPLLKENPSFQWSWVSFRAAISSECDKPRLSFTSRILTIWKTIIKTTRSRQIATVIYYEIWIRWHIKSQNVNWHCLFPQKYTISKCLRFVAAPLQSFYLPPVANGYKAIITKI